MYGFDHGWMYGGSGGGWMLVGWLWIAFVILVSVLLLLALFKYLFSRPGRSGGARVLEILDEAYARGEIKREEYLQKRADLKGK